MRLAIALMCLILVFGCTGSPVDADEVTAPGTERGYGIKIINFEPDLSEVSSGQGFGLILQLKNVGNADAKTVTPEIYKKGSFTVGGADPSSINEIEKADIELNLPGGSAVVTWSATAPKVSTEYSYTLGARVTYNYKSEGRSEVIVLSRPRLVSLKQKGEPLPSAVADSSVGPVEVSIEVPEMIVAGDEDYKEFSMKILVQNVGDGIARCKDGADLNCVDTIEIDISGVPNLAFTDCEGTTSGTKATIGKTDLIGGKNAYITCKVKKTGIDPKGDYVDSGLIRATASYRYQTEAETDITVAGEGI